MSSEIMLILVVDVEKRDGIAEGETMRGTRRMGQDEEDARYLRAGLRDEDGDGIGGC